MSTVRRTSLCGILAGFSVMLLSIGGIIPLATYIAPTIAASILLIISYEFSIKTAFTLYCAVSILSILFVSDKELSFVYIFIYGLYTVFKLKFDSINQVHIRIFFKAVFCLIFTIICYAFLLFLFPLPSLLNEFKDMGIFIGLLFFLLFLFAFFAYDYALSKILIIYRYHYRKKFFR